MCVDTSVSLHSCKASTMWTATWRGMNNTGSKQRTHEAQETPESDKTHKAPSSSSREQSNDWQRRLFHKLSSLPAISVASGILFCRLINHAC